MVMTTQTEPVETGSNAVESRISPLSIAAISNLVNAGVEVDAVTKRVVELGMLGDGWLDGEGVAPDADGLAWLNFTLHIQHLDRGLPQPYLYPSQDGSVGCEWSIGRHECEVEIDLKRRAGVWTATDMVQGTHSEERELDLEDVGSWCWMNDRLRSFAT